MIEKSPVVESKPTGFQYVMLAIEVTKLAFYEYRDAVCDLTCLQHPIRGYYAMKRHDEVIARAIRKAHNTKDIEKINASVAEEKKHLKRTIRKLEMFFEDGICGLAFHFTGGNLAFFRRLAEKYTNNYIKGDLDG